MSASYLTKVKVTTFTAFDELELEFTRGGNILIGGNGTGKTHLLKVLYAALQVESQDRDVHDILVRLFLPHGGQWKRLIRQGATPDRARIEVDAEPQGRMEVELRPTGSSICRRAWAGPLQYAFIPVKEMLSNAPGFRSLYSSREVHFESIYADIIDKALLPKSKSPLCAEKQALVNTIEEAIGGKVSSKSEKFFLEAPHGGLEFDLVAEGFRKLALVWLLLRNGVLSPGSILFWDEPEANLNPRIMRQVVEILLGLQRMGVQVFLATHNYVLLKEFDLQKQSADAVRYHSLYFEDEKHEQVRAESADDYTAVHPNAIADTYIDLYDRDVARALGGRKG